MRPRLADDTPTPSQGRAGTRVPTPFPAAAKKKSLTVIVINGPAVPVRKPPPPGNFSHVPLKTGTGTRTRWQTGNCLPTFNLQPSTFLKAQLVKVDAAALLTGQPARVLFDRAAGASLLAGQAPLMWVWDFSNGAAAPPRRRDLRFWVVELECPLDKTQRVIHALTLDQVLARLLPVTRRNFHAGEVDQMFQLRPRTRIDFGAELNGGMTGGRNFYERRGLENFLRARWLGSSSFSSSKLEARA